MKWRIYLESPPRTLVGASLQHWLAENTEVIEADKKFVTPGNSLCFSNLLPAKDAEVIETCGELCKDGKPCVRRKGHSINKRWQHMSRLAPKEPQKAELIGVADFNSGEWVRVKIEKE